MPDRTIPFTSPTPLMNCQTLSQESSIHIGAYTRVQRAEIVYCEGDGNYSHVHFVRRPTLMLSVTMRLLHERIGEAGFLRVSRSIVVNKECIAHYDGREILLRNGVLIPVARRRQKEVWSILKPILPADLVC